ncbi:hypothetical protein EDB81DRAFT_261487 [Dactylonectria macrodidyma]|uniref:BZIP domain-containing protein n=1 Tax=Dactylonectria macrodidyma TaxID=307937 RepID=A0A9P9FK93_9HYPO|nr:hypothetical protein EDB81DRAFT_261487 [Dactylonectria macrodidyma]
MTGGKSDSPANASAIRIRDNQRRSRARHKEYVEGLQAKLQELERRGVEATLEMQQAARNVNIENSRLRMLLSYHGVTTEEIDKFLKSFPDQPATEAAKAIISQSAVGQVGVASAAPKIPLQPLSRSPSIGSSNPNYVAPLISKESNTREVLDAIVGIKREPRVPDVSSPILPKTTIPAEPRQPLLQPRPPGPTLPGLPALILGQTRPDPNHVDRLSVLASASIQDSGEGKRRRGPPSVDSLHVPSPPNLRQSPPASNARIPSRVDSTSPRSQGRRSKSPFEKSPSETAVAAWPISGIQGNPDTAAVGPSLGSEGHENVHFKAPPFSRILDDQP